MWNGELWETYDLMGNCSLFTITPAGEMFMSDTDGCYDYEMVGQDDPRYDPVRQWKNWNLIRNGQRGKLRPCDFTGWIDLVPRLNRDRPNTQHLHFVRGKIQSDSMTYK